MIMKNFKFNLLVLMLISDGTLFAYLNSWGQVLQYDKNVLCQS